MKMKINFKELWDKKENSTIGMEFLELLSNMFSKHNVELNSDFDEQHIMADTIGYGYKRITVTVINSVAFGSGYYLNNIHNKIVNEVMDNLIDHTNQYDEDYPYNLDSVFIVSITKIDTTYKFTIHLDVLHEDSVLKNNVCIHQIEFYNFDDLIKHIEDGEELNSIIL